MKLKELFEIQTGNNLELVDCDTIESSAETFSDGVVNFIGRSSRNNGIIARVQKIPNLSAQLPGTLTVALSGSTLSTFLQNQPYYTSRDVRVLAPKKAMSTKKKLFYAMCISANAYRYNFGRQANKTLADLDLPDQLPRYVYNTKIKIPKLSSLQLPFPPAESWREFRLEQLFDVVGTTNSNTKQIDIARPGIYPHVTTRAGDNGVAEFLNYWTEAGNVLTIESAVKGTCTYQPENFSAGEHVEKLIPKFSLNQYIALFLVTLINRESYRYNYGRKLSRPRIRKTTIKLPVNTSGEIDWEWIERYIKSML